MTDKILIERHGPVTTLRLNDPETMNAITADMANGLHDAIKSEVAEGARALILAGSERAFSTGANLKAAIPGDLGSFDAGETLERDYNPLMLTIRDLEVPLISAVRGAAAGVGASLALACDLIVAGRDAYFLEAFARIGLVPDGGATWLLTRAVGRVRAMEMMLLAEKIDATKAHEWGLVTRLADKDAEAEALELASRLAQGPTRAYGLIRRAAWAAADQDFEATLVTERLLQKQAGNGPDFAEGLDAFLRKRSPNFHK
ncbi:enoyl-CoA hydratase-related protein [Lutimaribacter marinistellae]|uniref:Enoyl-CoA hydratase-related protein n=1 Tax=Lutimaribacter marinistellae TaxID=1820329 RepID=A0ABV7TAV1_9RHOB